jgi:sialidase-1
MPDYIAGNLILGRRDTPGRLGFAVNTSGRLELTGWKPFGGNPTIADGKRLGYDPTPGSAITVRQAATALTAGSHNAFPSLVRREEDTGVVLHAFYRSGTTHLSTDGIVCHQESADLGRTWSTPVTVWDDATYDVRDPSVRVHSAGTWIMSGFFHEGPGGNATAVQIRRGTGPESWDAPVSVTAGFTLYTACSDGVLELPNGDLLLAVYGKNSGDTYETVKIIKSTNVGLSWTVLATVANGPALGRGYQEPALIRLASGTIRCEMRTTSNVFYASNSTDSGATWSAPATDISSADGSPFLLQLASGRVLLTYRSFNTNKPIALRTADAALAAWTEEQVLDDESGTSTTYSEAVEVSPGMIAVLYGAEVGDQSTLNLVYVTTRAQEAPTGHVSASGLTAGGLQVLGAQPTWIGAPSSNVYGQRSTMQMLGIRVGTDRTPGTQARLLLSGLPSVAGDANGTIIAANSTQANAASAVSFKRGVNADYGTVLLETRGSNGFVPVMRWDENGRVIIGENNVSAQNTRGLLINQNAATDDVLTLKSTTVAHGMTAVADTNTFRSVRKLDGTTGGVLERSYRGTGSYPTAWFHVVHTGATADTTISNTARAVAEIASTRISGNTVADVSAGENVFAIKEQTGGATINTALFRQGGNQWLRGALHVAGDSAGVASTVTFVNNVNTAARGAGVGTVKFADGTSRDSVGSLKFLHGTTVAYIHFFAAP